MESLEKNSYTILHRIHDRRGLTPLQQVICRWKWNLMTNTIYFEYWKKYFDPSIL